MLIREACIIVFFVPVLLNFLKELILFFFDRVDVQDGFRYYLQNQPPDMVPICLYIYYAGILVWREEAGDFDSIIYFFIIGSTGINFSWISLPEFYGGQVDRRRQTSSLQQYEEADLVFWYHVVGVLVRTLLQIATSLVYYCKYGSKLIPLYPESVELGLQPYTFTGLSATWLVRLLRALLMLSLLSDIHFISHRIGDLWKILAYKIFRVALLWCLHLLWTVNEGHGDSVNELYFAIVARRNPYTDMIVIMATFSILITWPLDPERVKRLPGRLDIMPKATRKSPVERETPGYFDQFFAGRFVEESHFNSPKSGETRQA